MAFLGIVGELYPPVKRTGELARAAADTSHHVGARAAEADGPIAAAAAGAVGIATGAEQIGKQVNLLVPELLAADPGAEAALAGGALASVPGGDAQIADAERNAGDPSAPAQDGEQHTIEQIISGDADALRSGARWIGAQDPLDDEERRI